MDLRKLISFGKGSYILSMPKGWIEENNLKKGDLISIDDGGFELVLRAGQPILKQELKEVSIDTKDKNIEFLKTEIVSSYLNGFDTINIHFEGNPREMLRIKDIIRNLSGLEIMEQTSSRIIAKNLINLNEISINNIIRRMDIITRAMIEDAMLCCKDKGIYDDILHRDIDVNRLYFLGYRVIKHAMKNPRAAKMLQLEPWQLHGDMVMILEIEKIADRQKRIARIFSRFNFDRQTIEALEGVYHTIGESYNEVMKAYYNNDKSGAFSTETTIKDKNAACNKLLENYAGLHKPKNKESAANQLAMAQIIENMKGTCAEIKNIARNVLCYE